MTSFLLDQPTNQPFTTFYFTHPIQAIFHSSINTYKSIKTSIQVGKKGLQSLPIQTPILQKGHVRTSLQSDSPGTIISTVSSHFSKTYGVPEDAVVVGGTTDSNAAFFAACASSSSSSSSSDESISLVPEPGTAVTSLGSTLAIKMVSRTFVEDASRGVYSHRLPLVSSTDQNDFHSNSNSKEAWLVGGASNVGCAILRAEHFSNDELQTLSSTINPQTDSPLHYYPLTKPGERFSVVGLQSNLYELTCFILGYKMWNIQIEKEFVLDNFRQFPLESFQLVLNSIKGYQQS